MITIREAVKTYKGSDDPALKSISLQVERGEFVFLVGASGSGKSTLMRMVLREDVPNQGSIHVLGEDLINLASRRVPIFRRRLGVVFQDFRLLPQKNVYENVAYSSRVIGKSRGFIETAVPDVLSLVGLSEKAKRMPSELSGGEQQRVAVARAIVNKPDILLADEPTGNLDPNTSGEIMDLLERINLGGTTVLMATHDRGIVDRLKKRVVELSNGEIIRDEIAAGYREFDTGQIPKADSE